VWFSGDAMRPNNKPGPFEGSPTILNCPAHSPFLKTLAASILNGSIWNAGAPEPHDLPGLTIYLPSQAAVQPLKLEFLWLSPNEATFLPRIRVLGDADPLDLFANYGTRMESTKAAIALLKKALAVPAAFTELERQIHLSAGAIEAAAKMRSTIAEPGERLFPDVPAVSAAAIAREIGALIDEAHNEAADLSRIDRLDSSEASGSEQLSLQLFRAVRKGWAAYKLRTNKLDGQERRSRLMAVEAEFIRQSKAPIIVAGSTASVAATMALMETLKGRPDSAIVLYGLDRHLDAESWAVLGDHPEHPQHGLHQLLSRLDVGRETIRDLAPLSPTVEHESLRRAAYLSEVLRPASTTAQWASFASDQRNIEGSPVPGLALIEAETTQDEAATIALILREALETKELTAALVTPDENLIGRVRHALTFWGLANPVEDSNPDAFALRVATTAASGKPEDLGALLRTSQGDDAASIRRCAELIDLGVLRQMWRPSSMADVPAALGRAQHAIAAGEARHPAMKRIEATEWEAARTFSERLLEALSPLTSKAEDRLSLREWTAAHSAVAERLAELGFAAVFSEEDEPSTLVEAAKVAAPALKLDLAGYAGFFGEISTARRKAVKENPHPRLFLRRPLDARLLAADVVVLGGLNEGSWPKISGPSPWLNRRDRAFVGLSPEERRIGLAAQDFAALAAVGSKVFLTRAKKVNGALARPSRWIARLKALATGAGKLEALQPESPWLSWTRLQRASTKVTPVECPAPRPPLAARPRRLSVTAIETWFANPYAIYARHILGLEPLRRIGDTQDARDKGILYHAALHRFFQAHPGPLPPHAADDLVRCLDKAADELGFNLENAPFWRPRFARFADWFTGAEGGRRAGIIALKSEVGGKLKLDATVGPFEVTARADRIDIGHDGAVGIYDFKTSANAAKISVSRGAPQLALEGLLVREGAFAGIPQGSDPELRYIVATGGEPPGDIVELRAPCAEVIRAAATGLALQIARFDHPDTPYAYERRAIFRDKADNDPYAHLARVKEWSAGGDEEEAGDD
jgi:ATP-dependent helicase/nuclease subunit B